MRLQLYPHQVQAVSWMMSRERQRDCHGIRGGILADEMGLGKTITILECIRRTNIGPTLIACPLCLVHQWASESRRMGFEPICISERSALYDHEKPDASSIVIVSFTCLNMRQMPFCMVYKTRFHRIVVDEAHKIRNPYTSLSKNLCSFPAPVRWAVTGTPMVNVVIPPRSVHTKTNKIRDTVAYALFLTTNSRTSKELGQVLSSRMSEIMLRRLKRDVLRHANRNVRITTFHGDLTPEEQSRYDSLHSMGVWACNNKKEGEGADVHVVTLILELRKICSAASWKFDTVGDHIVSLPRGTKSLVFCTFRSEIERVMQTLDGSVDVLMEYHGGVSQTERQQMIETFRESTYRSVVMVVQIDCGGTGLNLEDAQHVYITSPTWSPCTERQAIGRADRATTKHTVNVHRLITKRTIESYMCNRQQTKDAVAETLLMQKMDDIRGRLIDSDGLLESSWDDLCDIQTLFAM